jgi:hypothetical protein
MTMNAIICPGVELEKVLPTDGCHKCQTPNEGEYSCRLMLEKLLTAIVVGAILVAVVCTFSVLGSGLGYSSAPINLSRPCAEVAESNLRDELSLASRVWRSASREGDRCRYVAPIRTERVRVLSNCWSCQPRVTVQRRMPLLRHTLTHASVCKLLELVPRKIQFSGCNIFLQVGDRCCPRYRKDVWSVVE